MLNALPLPSLDQGVLTLKFIDHLIANLDRLINIRHLLYGLYLAGISTLITIIFARNTAIKKPGYLFFAAFVLGEIIVLLQISISMEIQANFWTLDQIFVNLGFVNKLTEIGIRLKEEEFLKILKHPYLPALAAIHIANIVSLLVSLNLWKNFKSLCSDL